MAPDTPPETSPEDLPAELARLIESARTATLATIRPDGRPRLIPVCFVAQHDPAAPAGATIHTPLDEKPKRVADPRDLARVRDVLARPEVELLVDRWDEDWRRLAWIRVIGRATVLEPTDAPAERRSAIERLRAKYPQYADQALEARPMLRIAVERLSWWEAVAGSARPSTLDR